ncbi:hypothetical protein QYE76_061491 [Lolium multiflorum]|uniref:CCHC-type domain-containing protein n=1 Tax=Lolium multiflorum TaxID=4521 RepID=A0AAD8S0T7_LOLMU|nr:hypothetical protein QYE76_061491 [Lolium multiflorum]
MAKQEADKNGSPSLVPPAPSSPVDTTTATLDDLKKLESSIVNQMKAMMMELVAQKPNPIVDPKASAEDPPPKANPFPLVDFVAQTTIYPQKEGLGETGTSTNGKDGTPVAKRLGGYHEVPPPSDYTINVPIPMPHILSHGSPPLLESNNFENWQFLMRSHVRSASTELWRIIEEGYSPRDPKRLTRREVVDDQLNATAINMIHMAITPKDRAHIRSLKTAKEAWDKLEKLFLGNASIQSSRFDEVNNMADNFIMIEGESPEEMYRRLISLAVQMQDLGATFVDDHWIKRKFYNALLPYEEVKLTAIRQNASFRAMTSDEVLSEVIALDISKKNAEDLVARAHNSLKPNLSLKMRVHEDSESDEDPVEWGPDDLKMNYHEHMALAAKKFWDGNRSRNTRPRRSRDSPRNLSKSPREGQRGRTCYNCGDNNHFVTDCMFERREDHGGRLIHKEKFKSLSKGFSKFSPKYDDDKVSYTKKPRAFIIREEYSSDEDEERGDKSSNKEGEGVAAIAITTPSISIFDSPNENLVTYNARCLMVKVSTEVKSPSKPSSSTNALYIDDATSLTVKREIMGLDSFLTNMQGDTKTHVGALLSQLGAAQDLIEEKERLEREAANEIASLKEELDDERNLRMSLEASVIVLEDTNEAIVSRLTKDRYHALELIGELKKKMLSLEEANKEKDDEDPNSCHDELVDQVTSLRRHTALLLEVNALQEEALDEYNRLFKEKTSCCNHEEEIAALETTKAKLLSLSSKQEESLVECLRMSKEKDTCCDHEEEIAALKRREDKLMEVNSMQEEALKEYFPLSKDRVCCTHESDKRLLMKMNALQEEALMEHFRVNKAKEVQVFDICHPHPEHEDEVNSLKAKVDRLQVQAKYLEGVIEAKDGAKEGSCNEGGAAIKPKRKRNKRTKKNKNKENMEINLEESDASSRRDGVPNSASKGFAGSNNHYKKYVDLRPSIFVTKSSPYFIYDDSMTKNRLSKTERQESTITTFYFESS